MKAVRFKSENDVLATTARISQCSAAHVSTAPPAVAPQRAAGGALDWTGCAIPKAAGKYPPPLERDILEAILDLLGVHPKIALAWRQNTGGFRVDDRYIRAAFKGCSDILGMLVGGRFFAIEVKRQGELPTPDQIAFLLAVNRGGGLAFVARDLDDVVAKLAAP